MKKFYVGIDISKSKLDVAVYDAEKKKIANKFVIKNEADGIQSLFSTLKKEKINLEDCWFCFEHTGHYGFSLCYELEQICCVYSIIPALQIKLSLGMTRGKNDQVDAERIAMFAYTFRDKLQPSKMSSGCFQKIKQLLTYRNQMVRISTQLQNSLKSHQAVCQLTHFDYVVDEIKKQIIEVKVKIESIDELLMSEIKRDKTLENNFNLLKTIKGIGPIISIYLLVLTQNFESFTDARKFNCYAGIAPFEHSSGSSIRGKTKTSSLRNKTIKSLLFNGANAAALHDKEINNYYKRKKEEGKHHQSIMNAIACKLVYRAFSVIKRQSPYVTLYAQNF